ncbi:hypothetical protein LWI28_020544 [Acer negundo]|uniref:H(+)-transporting two-sector ATPase n=1 Tax=Acer negundo TaxID=4023 RepID=A0AAD5NNS2_ACENE|nr:hypothetical protein LWI28_020544 [Acer negundo]
MPSAVGYQPTLSIEMGSLQERITSTNEGSITSIQAVYVPADDLTDPAHATTFAHLDVTTCCLLAEKLRKKKVSKHRNVVVCCGKMVNGVCIDQVGNFIQKL